ncbi:MAG: prepilin-type N-terminal cleavage/methylation domain-containing protein [Phycisphaeraceae bacterium]|nr:prepilin-type N-terminal cleavage/methylation domain-containing protein [Phycisphaeraceae bacterium]MCB9847249.1 prepilin-type N-terminal cleavage/methylation domain-containing protein [Phycisphaeraceae bacterium]
MTAIERSRATIRRAFTLIEVLLTMVITSMILVTVAGIFAMMARANTDLGARYDDLGELARAHSAVRLALQSLVSGQPVSDLLDEDENPGQAQGGSDRPSATELRERLDIKEEDMEPLHFVLEQATEAARAGVVDDDIAPRRLEIVMERQPTPLAPTNNGQPVRGAFEPVYLSGSGQYTHWALDYVPIQPSGKPIRLINDAALIDWSVLGHAADSDTGERNFGLFQAQEAKDYPMAIRLVVITWDNTSVDWMFEPGVTVGEE